MLYERCALVKGRVHLGRPLFQCASSPSFEANLQMENTESRSEIKGEGLKSVSREYPWAAVGGIVPDGPPAYARVFHPAYQETDDGLERR